MRDNTPYFGEGGKNKFLEKKKREKEKQQFSMQQHNLITKIQKNIRKYIHIRQHQSSNVSTEIDLFFLRS